MLRKVIIVDMIIFISIVIGVLSNSLLGKFGLQYRPWTNIVFFLLVGSFVFLLLFCFVVKMNKLRKLVGVISAIGATVLGLIVGGYLLFFVAFSAKPEHIVVKEDKKYVAVVNSFLHVDVDYYRYVNVVVMGKDHKRYLRAVLVIILTALCTMKLPHRGKAIIQLIIPPIKTSPGSRLYLSGLIPILSLLWSYKEIVKSNYFNRRKSTIFILMFFFIVPILFKQINIVKTPYYTLNSGLKTIEVVDSKFHFSSHGESKTEIIVELHLKNYSSKIKKFNISLDMPKSLNKVISNSSVKLPNEYVIGLHKAEMHINESIKIEFAEGYSREDIFETHYYHEEYKLILFNENEELVVRCSD